MSETNKINLLDYQTILSYQGRVDGCVGSSKAINFIDDLSKDFKIFLGSAQGVLMEFEENKNANTKQMASIMCELYSFFYEDTEVIFAINQTHTMAIDSIAYKIIATGI